VRLLSRAIISHPHSQEVDFTKLLLCLVIDTIGTSSEILPVIGEVTDVVWAPIAGTVLRSLFGSNIVFAMEVVEEILPFTDFLPLATICWVVDTLFADSGLAKILGIGVYKLGRNQIKTEADVPPDDIGP